MVDCNLTSLVRTAVFVIVCTPFASGSNPPETSDKQRSAPPLSAAVTPNLANATNTIRTGFAGHFACQAFSGLDRELSIAISEEKERQAAWLIQDGANINARSEGLAPHDMTMLQMAIWYHWSTKSIAILLNSGADANAKDPLGDTPLIYVTRDQVKPNVSLVKALITHQADVNAYGSQRMTPLMYAALHADSVAVTATLIEAGADVKATDQNGWTALMHAARARHDAAKTVQYLLAAGAQVNRTHARGGTALMSACLHGNVHCAQILLQAGARINTSDDSGWTPLLCATIRGNADLVDLLLRAGANATQRDRLGRNALFLAELTGNEPIARRLRNAATELATP